MRRLGLWCSGLVKRLVIQLSGWCIRRFAMTGDCVWVFGLRAGRQPGLALLTSGLNQSWVVSRLVVVCMKRNYLFFCVCALSLSLIFSIRMAMFYGLNLFLALSSCRSNYVFSLLCLVLSLLSRSFYCGMKNL